MTDNSDSNRKMGLLGATGVGVGAIVGGGILAMAGAGFAATGPSLIIAFALNGMIALLTALSFAEVSSKFPQSGGTYTFAKKVLSIESAFSVGWIVWFASIVAAVLYAIGFAQFAILVVQQLWPDSPSWIAGRPVVCGLSILATMFYMTALLIRRGGSGIGINVLKIIAFAILIGAGFWSLGRQTDEPVIVKLSPFFANGWMGLFQAMGFTFIALQGFDLIAAVAGDVQRAERNVPRAMLLSLAIALLIYLPLLFVVSTAGMSTSESLTEISRENPESIIAIAAQNYLGKFGYWVVLVAGVLAMLSALGANIYAASQVAMSMAHDRSLPAALARLNSRGVPAMAVIVTTTIIAVLVLLVPDLAAAGAAASLIFLITFALVHWISVLVRQRSTIRPPLFQAPWFPLTQILGGTACVGLAAFQGFVVPAAGKIAIVWLSLGGLLFLMLFAKKARVVDSHSQAFDPEVAHLRGYSPLVLVPIARPDSAEGLVGVARALAPPRIGRVLLLSVVVAPKGWSPDTDKRPLLNAQDVLAESLRASASMEEFPEALATVATDPWNEIVRVARSRRCETVLLGVNPSGPESTSSIEKIVGRLDCDVVILRAEKGWRLSDVKRILIPTRGQGIHDELLARLLGSFSRSRQREFTFLNVVPESATDKALRNAERDVKRMANDLSSRNNQVSVVRAASVADEIGRKSETADMVILGVNRVGQKAFSRFVADVAVKTDCPLLLISRGG